MNLAAHTRTQVLLPKVLLAPERERERERESERERSSSLECVRTCVVGSIGGNYNVNVNLFTVEKKSNCCVGSDSAGGPMSCENKTVIKLSNG